MAPNIVSDSWVIQLQIPSTLFGVLGSMNETLSKTFRLKFTSFVNLNATKKVPNTTKKCILATTKPRWQIVFSLYCVLLVSATWSRDNQQNGDFAKSQQLVATSWATWRYTWWIDITKLISTGFIDLIWPDHGGLSPLSAEIGQQLSSSFFSGEMSHNRSFVFWNMLQPPMSGTAQRTPRLNHLEFRLAGISKNYCLVLSTPLENMKVSWDC